MLATIMYGDCVANHLREDGARARPRLDYVFLACVVHLLDATEKARLDVGAFFKRSAQFLAPSSVISYDDE
jgi:hypothetical protein